jgi:hypothetical protein
MDRGQWLTVAVAARVRRSTPSHRPTPPPVSGPSRRAGASTAGKEELHNCSRWLGQREPGQNDLASAIAKNPALVQHDLCEQSLSRGVGDIPVLAEDTCDPSSAR